MPIDYSQYCRDWRTFSRVMRFVIAGNRCEWCGAVNYEPHPDTGSKVILTVAHIDHDKTNNNPKNLRALCQRCHLSHDREHHARSRAANRRKALEEAGQLRLIEAEATSE